jgi:hypothetical protein
MEGPYGRNWILKALFSSLLNHHLPNLLSHRALKRITASMVAPPVDAVFADFEMPSNNVHARRRFLSCAPRATKKSPGEFYLNFCVVK